MEVLITQDYHSLSNWAATYIAAAINAAAPTKDAPFVLGLPTGSTPLGTYKALMQLHKEGKLSFRYVITFNMDEYVGLPEEHPESYHSFMEREFFSHIDINPNNIHILNGNADNLADECKAYEETIASVGGIRLFLGGIGVDGHIAFNEPGSDFNSLTREASLDYETRVINSRFFGGKVEDVPETALTVGIKTITDAQEVLLLASGKNKAEAVRHAVEGEVTRQWPASVLQYHNHAIIACDREAACALTNSKFGGDC